MRSGSETASTPASTVSDPPLSMIRRVHPRTPNGCEECWTVVMGVLSVLAGLLVLVYPAISLLTLVVVLSVWLLVLGLMEITLAIRARSAGRRIEDRALHPV